MYHDEGQKIFPGYSKFQSFKLLKRLKLMLKHKKISVPQYDNKGLQDVLEKVFKKKNSNKDKFLKDVGRDSKKQEDNFEAKPILLIPAYDTLYRNTTFFSNHYDKSQFPNGHPWYYEQPLYKICTSSASAPTFFPGFELTHEERLYIDGNKNQPMKTKQGEDIKFKCSYPHVDGGVTVNNPSLCAIAYALDLGYKLENISLLSIGTGTDTEPYEFKNIKRWGLINWARRISNLFMGGQAEIQAIICKSLMGGQNSERYLRLQFDLNQTIYDREKLTAEKNNKTYQKLRKKAFNKENNYSDEQIHGALQIYAQMPVIPKKKRINQVIGKYFDNNMDNAKRNHIEFLDKFAKEYINNPESYIFKDRNSHGLQVKEAIEKFIRENPPEEEKSQLNIKEERQEISV